MNKVAMVNDTIVKMSLLTSSAIDTIILAALMNTNSNAFAIKNFSVILINFLIIFFFCYYHIPHTNEDMWVSDVVLFLFYFVKLFNSKSIVF